MHLSPAFPVGIEDDMDESAEATFDDNINSENGTSESVLQDLFAGLEKRASQGFDTETATRSSGTFQVPQEPCNLLCIAV